VLIDAFVVRSLLASAVMRLLGASAWWSPARYAASASGSACGSHPHPFLIPVSFPQKGVG
jgi:uncharacterized membrane protein YdfJ with MMPL/SSD domain